MQIFENFNGQSFKLNSRKYVKNFIVMPAGKESIAIYNAFDTKLQLLPATHFSEVKINNASFPNQRVLMDTLSPMIFSKVVYSDGILPNQLIDVAEIVRNENQITIATAVWRIDGVVMSISQPFNATIIPTNNDYNRIDIIVAKSDGTLAKIQGEESQDVASQPLIPANSLFVTSINVFGDTIYPEVPVIGNDFVKKSTLGDVYISTSADNIILPNIGKSNFIIQNIRNLTTLGLATFYLDNQESWLVIGTEIKITNVSRLPQRLKHKVQDLVVIPFNFPDGKDLIIADNTIAVFRYTGIDLMFESYSLPEFIKIEEKGQTNGVATLDGNKKIPLSQINDVLIGSVNYQGNYDASTNTPNLPSAIDNKGKYFVVNVAGNQHGLSFTNGDWIISNGTIWEKVDSNNDVTSVAGKTGAIILSTTDIDGLQTILNSKLTQNGDSFGTTLNIGTNDNNDISLKRGNLIQAVWNATDMGIRGGNGISILNNNNNLGRIVFGGRVSNDNIHFTRNTADANAVLDLINLNASSTGNFLSLRTGSLTSPIAGITNTAQFFGNGFGTITNSNATFLRNGTAYLNFMLGDVIQVRDNMQFIGVAGPTYSSLKFGPSGGAGPMTIQRNRPDAISVFAVDNQSNLSTGNIIDFKNQGTTISGVRNDGRIFGSNGSAPNDFVTLSQLPISTANTGLEKITQDGKSGWRLIGVQSQYYGNTGQDAIDLSVNTSNSGSGNGAIGNNSSVLGGSLNKATGSFSQILGGDFNEANSDYSIAIGRTNVIQSGSDAAIAVGSQNTISSGAYNSLALGQYNTIVGAESTSLGSLNIVNTYRETVLGAWSANVTGSANTWVVNQPIFRIGIGTSNSDRKDAFRVYKNGWVELTQALPSATSTDLQILYRNANGVISTKNQDSLIFRKDVSNKLPTIVAYNLLQTDERSVLQFFSDNAVTVTIPTSILVNTRFEIRQMGLGKVTVQGANGTVIVKTVDGKSPSTLGQYAHIYLEQTGSVAGNSWIIRGDLANI